VNSFDCGHFPYLRWAFHFCGHFVYKLLSFHFINSVISFCKLLEFVWAFMEFVFLFWRSLGHPLNPFSFLEFVLAFMEFIFLFWRSLGHL
jgi:hypothetical protein